MPTAEKLIEEKLKLYELNGLFKEVRKIQTYVFKNAVDFYIAEKNKLSDKSFMTTGTLAATAVNQFEKRLSDAIVKNAGYRSEIRKYMTSFDTIDRFNVKLHRQINGVDIKSIINLANKQKRDLVNRTAGNVLSEISETSVWDNLAGRSMRDQFTKPVKKILYQNIMQGSPQSEAKKALHDFIVGNKKLKRIGRLERWSGQIARDTLSQYDGAINDMVRKEFDLDGWLYVGSLVKDSRPQCVRWKRMKEIPAKILPKELANPMNKGQIPGTTRDNFGTYKGGYNCAHSAFPIRLTNK